MLGKDSCAIPSFILFVIFILTTFSSNTIWAAPKSSIMYALERGYPSLTLRARKEHAKENKFLSANSSTIRSQLSYQSSNFHKNYLFLEMINVSSWLSQRYNPNSIFIKKPMYSVINDPRYTGVTNAYISSEFFRNTEITFGRQYISLNNGRMVGNNDFRQFPLSFDALTITNDALEDFDILYSFATNINTSNSDGRRKLRTNLINFTWHDFLYGKVVGYLYKNHDLAISSNSNLTFGFRVTSDDTFNKIFNFDYEIEVAHQSNTYNNMNKYSSIYFHISYNKNSGNIFQKWLLTGKIGLELIGSGNYNQPEHVFTFPLGNTHGFNGLAEAYTIIPKRGLTDYYMDLTAEYSDWLNLIGAIHVFQYTRGGQNKFIGIEYDLSTCIKINKSMSSELIFAILNSKNKPDSIKRLSISFNYLVM